MTPFGWTDREVRAALDLAPAPAHATVTYREVSTDSRSIQAGDLFVALTGEHFDGHDYVAQALSRGAAGAVVSRSIDVADAPVYRVDDTREALGALARHRRRALPARVVGITGSAGKTTAKNFTRGALSASLRVHATAGNLNNQVGLPLTLLAAPEDAEVVVVEMGTNEPGEIGILTRIAEPEIGMVTTVGETHLEKLGSVDGVLAEKLDLLRGLGDDGKAIVGDEPPALPDEARRVHADVRVAGWSDRADADLRPANPRRDDRGRYEFAWRGEDVALAVPGRHTVVNALLALAVADLMGVAPKTAVAGVAEVEPADMRGEVRAVGGLTLLIDCYNASPQSVRAALETLEALPAPRGRIAVLGTMLELGSRSNELHDDVLADALGHEVDRFVAVGEFARAARRSEDALRAMREGRLVTSDDAESAYAKLAEYLRDGVAVLLKASRAVRLERLLEPLQRDFGDGGGA